MDKTLVIGYGNPDREDDGVAWHVLSGLAERLGLPEPELDIDGLNDRQGALALLCVLQLTPELGEVIASYDQVCFVDAHTGAFQEDLRLEALTGVFQASPFTHHMTPETCLALAEALYGHAPQGVVVSIRGYQFGFSNALSSRTALLAEMAVEQILSWLNSGRVNG